MLPPLSDAVVGTLEGLQRRALLAMLGPAASPGAHGELVLYVFGRWQLRERRLLARLVFVRSLALSLARPERGAVVTALAALVGESSARGMRFAAESATAAVLAALAEFGVGALPSPADAAAMRGPLWAAARGARGRSSGGATDDGDSDDDGAGGSDDSGTDDEPDDEDDGYESDGTLEGLQRRALLAMLGPAASPGEHGELVLYVFDRWQLRERRLLARLVFVRSLALSARRRRDGARRPRRRAECAWHAFRG